MPELMQKQMVSIQFSEPVGESSLEWSVKLNSLPPEDRQRLELVDNTISKYDILSVSYSVIITARYSLILHVVLRSLVTMLPIFSSEES